MGVLSEEEGTHCDGSEAMGMGRIVCRVLIKTGERVYRESYSAVSYDTHGEPGPGTLRRLDTEMGSDPVFLCPSSPPPPPVTRLTSHRDHL